jgi:hypothetical protein
LEFLRCPLGIFFPFQDSERVREEITQMGHDSNALMRNTNEMLKKLVIQQGNAASAGGDPKQLRVQTVILQTFQQC